MARVSSSCSCGWVTSTQISDSCSSEWITLTPVDVVCESEWNKLEELDSLCISEWAKLEEIDSLCFFDWIRVVQLDQACESGWEQNDILDESCGFSWEQSETQDVDCGSLWDKMTERDISCSFNWNKTTEIDLGCSVDWDAATPLDVICDADCSGLDPITNTIFFYCDFPWLAERVNIVINQEVSFIRVSDSQEIRLLNVSVSTDIDSFFWTIKGTVASRADLAYIRPNNGPVETQLVINNYTWRFLIENVNDDYVYESGGSYSFNGTSPSVLLAKPYCEDQTKTYTSTTSAHAIINAETVADGWTVTYGITDWSIPADAYGVQGVSRAEICAQIAKACGGFVNTRGGFPNGTAYAQELLVNYRYKESPKDWDSVTMDHTIVDGVIKQSIKWEPKPKYDHVWVTGQDQGYFAHVIRYEGTQAEAAPTITDVLLTALDTVRERGRNYLDQEGYDQSIYNMDLTLPDSTVGNPALMHPGELAEFSDLFETWRGMIRGVSISVGYPGVTQSIEVERHYTVTGTAITWDNSFTITLDNTNVDSDLTNFPVLIYLSASSGITNYDCSAFFTELQNEGNRKKIKIEDETSSQCYVEIEKYDQTSSEAWLWVRVPTLKTGSPTVLTLYYDKDVSDNAAYIGDVGSAAANNVWPGYISVYHMNNTPDGIASIKDSCLSNDATSETSMSSSNLVAGISDQAISFDGVDDYINCQGDGSLRPNSITIEVWSYSGSTASKFLVSNPASVSHSYYDYALKNDGFQLYTAGGAVSIGSRTPVQNTWEYIAATHTSGAQAFYIDGVSNDTDSVVGDLSYETSGNYANTYLGCWQPTQNNENIIIDEVRISNTARSADWIKATWYSNDDNLATFSV